MEYFMLKQYDGILNYINPKFSFLEFKEIWNSSKPMFLNLSNEDEKRYLPILNDRILIVSEELKKILEEKQTDIIYRSLILADTERKIIKMHYFTKPKEIDCLSKKTEYEKNGKLKKIVLDKEKIEDNKVFKIKGVTSSHMVVELEIIEKMFQQSINELKIERLDMEEMV